MRILILISSLEGGGAERVASRLANALSERHEVYIMPFSAARHNPYPLSEKVKVKNAGIFDLRTDSRHPVIRYAVSIIYGYFYMLLINLFRHPDVTLSFLTKPNLLNAFSIGGGRKIMSERNNPKRKGEKTFKAAAFAYSKADKVIFQSDTVRRMFSESIQSKGVILPNPIEVPCEAVGGSRKIVTGGRMKPQKNHAMLIRSFAIFAKDHPDHTLHIYGGGMLEEKLRDLVRELSLEGKVFLEGGVPDLHEKIKDAEMFVLSSEFEGMPNVLLEAMMMGIPCVTTTYEGAEELFGDSGSCLMVPVGDEVAMAGAMARLDGDPVLRQALSERGTAFASRFSMDKVIPLWEKEL